MFSPRSLSRTATSPLHRFSYLSRRQLGLSVFAASVGALLRPSDVASASSGVSLAPKPALDPSALLRLGSNENPHGAGSAALSALRLAAADAHRYPGESVSRLSAQLAAVHAVAAEQILLSPGSGDILRAATLAFTSPAAALVAAAPTFEAPGRVADAIGAPVRLVPVDASGAHDLAGMAAKVEGAGLVFVCNPNNPTGAINSAEAVTAFIARVAQAAPSAVVLVDEAYFEYVDSPAYATAIPLIKANPQVVVSRTFSKIHGMAGLRVGYAIGQPATLARMRRHLGQGAISGISAAAALASLNDHARLAQQKLLNKEARAIAREAFETAGYPVLPSEANFLMIDVKRDAKGVQALCREAGLLVARQFPALPTHVRLSVGTLDETRRAVAVMLPLLAAPSSASRGIALAGAEAPDIDLWSGAC